MQKLISSFLNFCRHEKCLSETTLIGYERYLHRFSDWCSNEGYKDLKQFTPERIRQFLAIVRGPKGEHEGTLSSIVYILRSFGKFLQREINLNPFHLLEAPQLARKLPEILSKQEVKKLIESAETPLEKATLEILYSSGLRASELCSLKYQDVNLTTRQVKIVCGKGGKDGIVPLGNHAITAIKEYIKAGELDPAGYLFPALNRCKLHTIVKQCAERAGITKNVYPHLLRHSFATHLLDGGADIMSVKEMLRHSSVSTTQVYTQVSITKKLKECRKFWKARESIPREKPIPIPEFRKPSIRIGTKTLPKQYSTREKFIGLWDKVREYTKDKQIIRSMNGRYYGNRKTGTLKGIDIACTFGITPLWANRFRDMIIEERKGKKVNIDSLNLFWQEDFIKAKIKEATRLLLKEGKKLYPRRTVPRGEVHKYITMQELGEKIDVSYNYMYKDIWPELKKDERLVEKKEEATMLAGTLLDAEARLGELLKDLPIGERRHTSTGGSMPKLPKGITHKQSHTFRTLADNKDPRFNTGVVIHKTIDTLIADMIKVLGIDEQTARDTVADLIRNKDKIGNIISD